MTYDDMTNGFSSYQHIPAAALTEAAPQYHPARNMDEAHSVTISGGEVTERTTGVERGHSGQNNPHHGTDSILSTAVDPRGLPLYEIKEDTLVQWEGMQVQVKHLLKEGVLMKGPDGKIVEAPQVAQEAPPEEVDPDAMDMHPQNLVEVQQALQGIEEHGVDALASYAIGEATGRLDEGALLKKFNDVTGMDGAEAKQRVNILRNIFQTHANRSTGIPEADLPEFWQWTKTHQRDQLQAAIGRQLHGQSLGGYKTLAKQWLAATPVSLAGLQAAGIPTRASQQKPGEVEIFVKGVWTSRAAAARLGYL